MPPSEIAWHWNNTQVDAILDNPEASIDVRLQKMVAFFKIMKIDGVGEGVVTKLIRGGYDDLQMILTITPDIISKVEGFQLKSATNIYNAIKKVIEKPQPLERVMTASGIFQIGLGEKKFKAILDAIPDFMAKYKNGKIGIQNITSISGFSDKTAGIFIDGMPRFLEWLTIHSMIKIDIEDIAKRDIPKGNKFAGIVVVFTGVRNSNMEKVITDGGGVVGSSITGKTTLLVAKDPSENSSKIEKAKNAGIQIISYEQFSTDYDL
jgi:DNA ligase (NAD+)